MRASLMKSSKRSVIKVKSYSSRNSLDNSRKSENKDIVLTRVIVKKHCFRLLDPSVVQYWNAHPLSPERIPHYIK